MSFPELSKTEYDKIFKEHMIFEDIIFHLSNENFSIAKDMISKFEIPWIQTNLAFAAYNNPLSLKLCAELFKLTGKPQNVIPEFPNRTFSTLSLYLYSKGYLQRSDFSFDAPLLNKNPIDYENIIKENTIEYYILHDDADKFISSCQKQNIDIKTEESLKSYEIKIIYDTYSIITFALYCGSINIIKYLISNGIEIPQKTYYMKLVVECGSEECIKFFIKNGYSFDDTLGEAISHHHNKIALFLIEKYKQKKFSKNDYLYKCNTELFLKFVEDSTLNSNYCIHMALQKYYTPMVNYLIQFKLAPINEEDSFHWTTLHYACLYNNFPLVEYLVSQKNTDIKATDRDNICQPIHYACDSGNIKILSLLVEKGADVNAYQPVKNQYYPLHIASLRNHLDCVKYLVEHGAKIDSLDTGSNTPLMLAAKYNSLEVFQYLYEQFPNQSHTHSSNGHLIHIAAQNNSVEIISYLIEKQNVDVNSTNIMYEKTPLIQACISGCFDSVKCLVEHGASINQTCRFKKNALYYACTQDSPNLELIQYLVEHDAKIDQKMIPGIQDSKVKEYIQGKIDN